MYRSMLLAHIKQKNNSNSFQSYQYKHPTTHGNKTEYIQMVKYHFFIDLFPPPPVRL